MKLFRKKIAVLLIIVVVLLTCVLKFANHKNIRSNTPKDEIGYFIGYTEGESIVEAQKREGISFNNKNIVNGFNDGINKQKSILTKEQIKKILKKLQNTVKKKKKRNK